MSIDIFLKIASVLQAGAGKNPATALYCYFFCYKKAKITKGAYAFKNYTLTYVIIQNCNLKILNLLLKIN